MPGTTLEAAAERLAALLTRGGGTVADASGADLVFDGDARPRPLARGPVPDDAWAVDGGQGIVADARCLQLVVTRAARVRFRGGACVLEDDGDLAAHLLGGGEGRAAVAGLGLDVAADASLEGAIHLLRDGSEWLAVERCVDEAEPGALVLVDGDLQPDWRIRSEFVAGVLERAESRHVLLAGITKHSSLSRGGAPLIGQLELEAAATFGPRGMWWAPLARTRPDLDRPGGGPERPGAEGASSGRYGLQVVAARLDPDARFAFRVDLPAGADAADALSRIAALADDAAFPGYPYPLSVADRLAACPGWLRDEVRLQLDDHLDRLAVPLEVRERAFADRHALMERF